MWAVPVRNPTTMKIPSKYLTAVLMSGVFAVATYAAPPGKETAVRRANKPAPAEVTAACKTMRSLATGGAKGQRTVRCTPELMKRDARCRAMCEATSGTRSAP